MTTWAGSARAAKSVVRPLIRLCIASASTLQHSRMTSAFCASRCSNGFAATRAWAKAKELMADPSIRLLVLDEVGRVLAVGAQEAQGVGAGEAGVDTVGRSGA